MFDLRSYFICLMLFAICPSAVAQGGVVIQKLYFVVSEKDSLEQVNRFYEFTPKSEPELKERGNWRGELTDLSIPSIGVQLEGLWEGASLFVCPFETPDSFGIVINRSSGVSSGKIFSSVNYDHSILDLEEVVITLLRFKEDTLYRYNFEYGPMAQDTIIVDSDLANMKFSSGRGYGYFYNDSVIYKMPAGSLAFVDTFMFSKPAASIYKVLPGRQLSMVAYDTSGHYYYYYKMNPSDPWQVVDTVEFLPNATVHANLFSETIILARQNNDSVSFRLLNPLPGQKDDFDLYGTSNNLMNFGYSTGWGNVYFATGSFGNQTISLLWTNPGNDTIYYINNVRPPGNPKKIAIEGEFKDVLIYGYTATGMEPQPDSNGHFSVYPSPTKNHLTVDFYDAEPNQLFKYEIVNISGKTIQAGTVGSRKDIIDVKQLSSGVYILRIAREEFMETIKFIRR